MKKNVWDERRTRGERRREAASRSGRKGGRMEVGREVGRLWGEGTRRDREAWKRTDGHGKSGEGEAERLGADGWK